MNEYHSEPFKVVSWIICSATWLLGITRCSGRSFPLIFTKTYTWLSISCVQRAAKPAKNLLISHWSLPGRTMLCCIVGLSPGNPRQPRFVTLTKHESMIRKFCCYQVDSQHSCHMCLISHIVPRSIELEGFSLGQRLTRETD